MKKFKFKAHLFVRGEQMKLSTRVTAFLLLSSLILILGSFAFLKVSEEKCTSIKPDEALMSKFYDAYKNRRYAKYAVSESTVPLTYYGSVDNLFLGYQIAMHNVALKSREHFYSYFKTKNKSELEKALFYTDFMVFAATWKENGAVILENNFYWPPYKMDKPWSGAIVQGGFIKSLMLAYQATGREEYFEIAEKALDAFRYEIEDCGLLAKRSDNGKEYYWYPEYAVEEPPFVLNGFITSLIWINEYHQETKSENAKEIYEKGLEALVHFLPYYDAGDGWSYYDAQQRRASVSYHEMHAKQMNTLYNLTGSSIFREYAEKWSAAN